MQLSINVSVAFRTVGAGEVGFSIFMTAQTKVSIRCSIRKALSLNEGHPSSRPALSANHMAQLPLEKGDAVFFNPAYLHQPNSNTTSSPRVANLLQVSDCWGTPMKTIDKLAIAKSV